MTTTNTTATNTITCGRCGRPLRSTTSKTLGYGPTCHRKVRAAQNFVAELGDFKPVQMDKAAEVIELRGIVRTSRDGVFHLASSRGDAVYETDVHAASCTCPAGEKARRCYHLAAAIVLTAA